MNVRARLLLSGSVVAFVFSLSGGLVCAGNIDPSDTGTAFAYGENVGWINFKPTSGDGVTVTVDAVSGFAWGENVGWINFNPANGGVVNDGVGHLSGLAWGENVGWINFAPDGGGVTIDELGRFAGYAWAENVGWINFAPSAGGVTTAWKAPDLRAPLVTPPVNVTVRATEVGGARGSASTSLATFLAGGSAVDVGDPSPARLSPLIGTVNADDTTLFPLGASTVTFRFRDASGNVGSATALVTVLVASDLAVTRTEIGGPLHAEQSASYTVMVRNNGPHEAGGVTLTDALSSVTDFTFVSASGAACSFAGQTVTCNLGTLASGAVLPVTITVTPRGAGTLSATAAVTSDADPNAANNAATTAVIRILAGNIDPADTGAAFAYGENVGWINLKPAFGPGVTVRETTVTGFAWGENVGWITLSPANGGVVNDRFGRLSGFAWGESVGWINFAPEGGGVTIDEATGHFRGFAWGENVGWINFAPSQGGVTTSWRPDRAAPTVTAPAGITVFATGAGGARGPESGALATFLAGGSAVDAVDPTPERLAAQVAGADVDSGTVFSLGTTDVAFRFRDASGNIGIATAQVTVVPVADLSISMAASPNPVQMGQPLTYTITVTNSGPSGAAGVTLTDSLPFVATFVSATVGCGQAGGTVTCNLGALASGASVPVTIVVTPTATSQLFPFTSTASVTSSTADPNPANDGATVSTTVIASADLSVTTSVSPASAVVGLDLTYTVTVTNAGPAAAFSVVLTNTLPSVVTFVSATPSQGSCSGTATVTCDLVLLNIGASATVTIVVTPTTAGTKTNTASVTSSTADPDMASNTTTVSTTVNSAIFVNSTAQLSGSTGTVCTLGAAIHAANLRTPVDGCAAGNAGGSTIILPAGTYTLTAVDNTEPIWGSATALPVIKGVITIQGAGAETTIIERAAGAPSFRLFWIASSATIGSRRLTLNDITLRGGRPSAPGGGGVFNDQMTLAVNRSVLSDHDGAAIASSSYGGTLTVTDSTFSGNVGGLGGAISHTGPLSVTGSRFIANSTRSNGIGGAIVHSGDGTIADSVFIGNTAAVFGGAIYFGAGQHIVSRSTFAGNTALGGGAMRDAGNLAVVDSVFSSNTATAGVGGAIDSEGAVAIRGSTFDGNTAIHGGALNLFGAHAISNSTFSGNSAGSQGGAVRLGNGTLAVNNVTVVGNHAGQRGGGFFSVESYSITIRNSIVAGNTGGGSPECDMDNPNVGLISLGHNLIGNRDGCSIRSVATDQLGTGANPLDPRLGPLADNGGRMAGAPSSRVVVQTHAPLPGSPVIDAGNPATPGEPGSGAGLTIEAWINPSDVSTQRPLVDWNDGAGTSFGVNFWIAVASSGGGPGSLWSNLVDTTGAGHPLSSAPGVIAAGTFQHVAVAYDKASGVGRLYRDGVIVAEANLGTFTPLTTLSAFLGGEPPSSHYSGVLDEVTLYGRALTQAEIHAIVLAGSAGKCRAAPAAGCVPPPAGLLRWWPGDGNANDIADGVNGTLENGATFAAGMVGQAFSFDGADDQVRIHSVVCEPTDQRGTARATDGNADGTSRCDIGAVEVRPPPGATAQSVTTAEDTPVAVTLAGNDPSGGPLTFAVATLPAHGVLIGTPPNVTYTPGANFNGADSFTFAVTAGTLTSSPATVSIAVTPVNDPPFFDLIPDQRVKADGRSRAVGIEGLVPGPPNEAGQALTLRAVSGNAALVPHPTVVGTAASQRLIYRPRPGASGTATITLTADDGQPTSNTFSRTFTVTVTGRNQRPTAHGQSVTTAEETPVAITLAASDADGDPLTFTLVKPPLAGTLTGTPPDLIYTPRADFHGRDRFRFMVSDGAVTSLTATVTVTVTAVNDPPSFGAIADQTVLLGAGRQQVRIWGVSPGRGEERTQTVRMTATSSNPALVPQPVIKGTGVRRVLGYQPAPGMTGTVIITVTADDGQTAHNTLSRTFTITVTPALDVTAPVFGGLSSATPLSPSQVALTWGAASDNATNPGQIVYVICQSQIAGQCVTSFVATQTTQGDTSGVIEGLIPDRTYFFVVRARDLAGNTDGNTGERSATTLR